ncbi:MAG TPA: PIN domain-containing protein [Candidatus Acidoferrales bacterium]|nr:PIN domain-containing protein [Candidatus Acidoferrales bacterium]
MNGKSFVDTNILVYAQDLTAGIKRERARALIEKLWDEGTGVLSTQVLQELCVNLRHKVARPMSSLETRTLIEDYLSWEIVVNTPNSVIEALEIEARHQISFWDALIVHAAEKSGAAILYSEDLSDGQIYGSVRVINPLRGPAAD